MSDTPVIFKRTKSKANQRAREETQRDEQGQQVQVIEPSPSAVASKIRNKAKQRAKTKTSLSFGAEEEEAIDQGFKVKKSNLSQRLTLRQLPTSSGTLPSNVDQASLSHPTTSRPVYDEAHLNELKASTPSFRPSISTGGDHDFDTPIISTPGDLGTESIADPEAGGVAIPSQSFVLAAKEKRERLRTSSPASSHTDDYISLSLTKRNDEYLGPHPESRLMREDDDLGEGDDDFSEYTSAKTRIALGKKAKKAEANKVREEMQDLIADAEDVDEETQEWEQAQIKRSGLRPDDNFSTPVATSVYKATPIPPPTEVPGLETSVTRISQTLVSMTTSHAQNTASVSAVSVEYDQLDGRETELREIIAMTEEKRRWFADFRDWLENVATFLDEKFPQLEQLEDEHISILKERRDMIRSRRRAENEDDLSLFLRSSLTVPVAELEDLDDMGRDIPRSRLKVTRDDRQSARAARRATRRKNGCRGQDEEGYSTDATLPLSDATDYLAALELLSRKRDDILSDVKANEFKDPSLGIGIKFAEWRERFEDSYQGAWGGLGLVGAWEFWSRLEMLGWNPFEDSRTLDSYRWHGSLYKYSRPNQPDEDEEEPQLGPDGDLVSAIVSTTVLPRLSKLVEGGAFDPYSSKNIRRLLHLIEEIEVSVEKNHHRFQVLFNTVLIVFQDAVNDLTSLQEPFLATDSAPFHPGAIAARSRLLAHQEKLMSNILRWRKYSNLLFGIDEVARNLLVNCILPIAKTGWEVGGQEHVHRISRQLPKELATLETKAELGILES
ncbi:GCFC-domain-containing protein [Lactarius deliciosus]|nr:GCFC-domain-containing protein [Lactarius deliciosus]